MDINSFLSNIGADEGRHEAGPHHTMKGNAMNTLRLLRRSLPLLLTAAGLALAPAAFAQDNVLIVHAIPGTDLGLSSDDLAVDIRVGGACALAGVEFGQSATDAVGVGTYDVEISLANGSCSGTLAAVGSFTVNLFQTVVVVAHLDQSGAPVISSFGVDASELDDDDARVTFFHGAAAPTVELRGSLGRSGRFQVKRLDNGLAAFPIENREGDLRVDIRAADSRGRPIFRASGVPVEGNAVVIAAGTAATLQPVIAEVP
jgi:hypothetical protein